ncbi:MAG: polysaccharide biosynthesis tyrosine autokinase [Pantoea dispersa]|uniref:polysaccharide biosynthesis tyrosine autokinase n=1 Tax=Pantoea dispersa TaxID=59814 RepID=UPI00285AD812|nr:polysaccharide biosynthesis tyrosine autokinase [Pantoea dispersa]MDR6295893.1 tyrosine-protein kinase Etk/Wzc [Pantoea dispersa]
MTIESVTSMNVNDEDGIAISRLFAELNESRYLILAITIICSVLALICTSLMPTTYQANALIQVVPKKTNAILGSMNKMLPGGKPVSAIDVALLQSRHLLGATVDDLNLQVDVQPKRMRFIGRLLANPSGKGEGTIHVSQLYLPATTDEKPEHATLTIIDNRHYQVNYQDHWFIAETGEVTEQFGVKVLVDGITAPPGAQFIATYISRLDAINNIRRNLTILDLVRGSGMINLTLIGHSREQTIRVLDNITWHYLNQNISEQTAQDSKSLNYLNQQLPAVRNTLDRDEDKLNVARENNGTVNLPLEAKSVLEQSVLIDSQLNALTVSEAEISQLYTKVHPTYKTLLEKRNTLLAAKAKLKEKIAGMPAIQQEILTLTQDVESEHDVYMRLLARQQELKIAVSSAIGNVRIVDNAADDQAAVAPQKIIIVLQGLFLGLLVSANVVFIRLALDKAIESAAELEQRGMTVYTSIPYSEWQSKTSRKKGNVATFLLEENPTDLAIEAIRALRTNMHFAMFEARNNILMISGASAGAGKTFISTNLSAAIAQSGKKVLLIDADLRRGTAHQVFNVKNAKGLSEILAANYPIDSTLVKEVSGNLHFISRGNLAKEFTELLMSERLGELMKWAQGNYDIVVVDTPPVLAVTDAEIIGTYAGTSLLVIRCDKNNVKEMEISVQRFERNGIKINGCILNGAKARANGFYQHGDFHYAYD